MDQEIIILSEVKSEKDRQTPYHLYTEYKKMIQMNLFTKQKQIHIGKKPYGCEKGKEQAGRDKLGI